MRRLFRGDKNYLEKNKTISQKKSKKTRLFFESRVLNGDEVC
jgi:hypothetical protein